MSNRTSKVASTNKKKDEQRALLEQMPAELRVLAEEFNRQNQFFADLLKRTQTSDSIESRADLWRIPSGPGLTSIATGGSGNPWFSTLFEWSKSPDALSMDVFESFAREVTEFSTKVREQIQQFQESADALSTIQKRMSDQAQKNFLELVRDLDPKDSESICQAWLKAGERAFQTTSADSGLSEEQSKLMNAVSQLKKLQSDISARFAQTFGLPQQQEMTDLQKGLHKLRMAFAEYRDESTQVIADLQTQIKQLKRRPSKSSAKT